MEDFSDIPHSENWRVVTPILKGWSADKKYHVVDVNGREFLLRSSSPDQYLRKVAEFEMMEELSKSGANMSMPLNVGRFCSGRRVYTVLTWIAGRDAEAELILSSELKQYELGLAAGRLLRQLHTRSAPAELPDWDTRYGRKIDTKIANYLRCSIKIPSEKKILDFIDQNRSLIKNRPQTYQHGDYHVGNIIVTSGSGVGVVDFNRIDLGDPWEEFNRIVFCANVSAEFASGRIDGYFDYEVPDEFFRLMALYISVNSISAVPWAVPFGEEEVTTMLNQAKKILEFYDGFSTVVPSWYREVRSKMDGT